MPYTAYPTAAQVEAFIETFDITPPSTIDYEPYIASAIAQWERETRYKPFLTESSAQDYYYDPPGPNTRHSLRGGTRLLMLDNGFTTITSVRTGITPDDSTGTLLTLNTDYRYKPYNCVAQGLPVTMIEFAYAVYGGPRSIKLTGKAGFAADLPVDAWVAIRELAAGLVLRGIREAYTLDPTEIKEADVSERRSIELIEKMGDAWTTRALSVARAYTRLSY